MQKVEQIRDALHGVMLERAEIDQHIAAALSGEGKLDVDATFKELDAHKAKLLAAQEAYFDLVRERSK